MVAAVRRSRPVGAGHGAPVAPAERVWARTLIRRLAAAHPDWGPTLDFRTPLELLIATILAAQTRDERVNEVTPPLFARYRTAGDWLAVPDRVLERAIRPTGFFRQKARAIKGACQGIVERFAGLVPETFDDLVSLHGVGRKTAAIVAGNAFGVPSIAVDRHVARVANRLGLSRSADPDRIEADLRERLPRAQWVKATWCLILHGRRVCRPVPACPACPVRELCPYPKKTAITGPARPRLASASGIAATRPSPPSARPRRAGQRRAGG